MFRYSIVLSTTTYTTLPYCGIFFEKRYNILLISDPLKITYEILGQSYAHGNILEIK